MDNDAVLVPAITLQLTKDNTPVSATSFESLACNQNYTKPSSNDPHNTAWDLMNMEAGLLSPEGMPGTCQKEMAANSRFVFSSGSACNSSSSASFRISPSSSPTMSDREGMRYYPRQSPIVDGSHSKRDKRRSTFSDLFTTFPSSKNKLPKLSKLIGNKPDSVHGRRLGASHKLFCSQDANNSSNKKNKLKKRRYTLPVARLSKQSCLDAAENSPESDIAKDTTESQFNDDKTLFSQPPQGIQQDQMNLYAQQLVEVQSIQRDKTNPNSGALINNTIGSSRQNLSDKPNSATEFQNYAMSVNATFYLGGPSEPISPADSHLTATTCVTGTSVCGTADSENVCNFRK